MRNQNKLSSSFGRMAVLATVVLLVPNGPSALASSYTVTRASVSSTGQQAANGAYRPWLNGTGSKVAFFSFASNLTSNDRNRAADVFVHRNWGPGAGRTVLVSRASNSDGTPGAQGNRSSTHPQLSRDGSCVVFQSTASNLVRGDTNGHMDIFIRYVSGTRNGQTRRVSVAANGAQANGPTFKPTVSADCRYVAFEPRATNLVPVPQRMSVIGRHDMATGRNVLVSQSNGGTVGLGFRPSISANGNRVAFFGHTALTPEGNAGKHQVYVRKISSSSTILASKATNGRAGNGDSLHPMISPDGNYVAFDSRATNLVTGFAGSHSNIFVRNLSAGTTRLVSHSRGEARRAGNRSSYRPAVSKDGRYVEFYSFASNLVRNDTNGASDAFIWRRSTGRVTRTTVSSGGRQGTNGSTVHIAISADGNTVAMESSLVGLVRNDTNRRADIFIGHWTGRH
jgi:Tol biopolymer transport system component